MKTINKIAFITFAGSSILSGIIGIINMKFDLLALCVIFAAIAYTGYQDIKNPVN